mgnify:CR=1 FL=1
MNKEGEEEEEEENEKEKKEAEEEGPQWATVAAECVCSPPT